MDEWEINKPLGECYGSGKEIAPGQEYFGALVMTDNGLERRDFCTEYWQSEEPQVFCHWKTRLPKPDEKKQIFVDEEMLMAFFQRLEEERDQEKVNFRFVLALILMRKRRLKYDATRMENGREIWRLRVVGEGLFTEVVNPNVDEEQIRQLSSQIGQILHTDL